MLKEYLMNVLLVAKRADLDSTEEKSRRVSVRDVEIWHNIFPKLFLNLNQWAVEHVFEVL